MSQALSMQRNLQIARLRAQIPLAQGDRKMELMGELAENKATKLQHILFHVVLFRRTIV